MLSSLAEIAYNDPGVIESMFTANDNGTYTVRLYDDQNNINDPLTVEYLTVDDRLPNGGQNYDNPVISDGNFVVLWAALAEKAYAEVHPAPYGVPYTGGYGDINGGDPAYALAAFTGMATEDNWANSGTVESALLQYDLPCLCTPKNPDSSDLVGSHCYAVLNYDSSSGQFLFYNPWGLGAAGTVPSGVPDTTSQTILTSGIPVDKGDLIQIDDELMLVNSVSGNSVSVTRGYDSDAAEHNPGARVYVELPNNGEWTQLIGSPIVSVQSPVPGLFTEASSVLDDSNNFDGLGQLVDVEKGTGGVAATRFDSAARDAAIAAAEAPAGSALASAVWPTPQAAWPVMAARQRPNNFAVLDAPFSSWPAADEERWPYPLTAHESRASSNAVFAEDEPPGLVGTGEDWWSAIRRTVDSAMEYQPETPARDFPSGFLGLHRRTHRSNLS